MVVEEHRNLDSVLECLASPIRLEILKLLSKKKLGYIELMENLGLDKNRDAGKFSYHLKKLQTSGLIELDKDSGKYVISREGLVVLDFLEKLEKNLGLKNVMMVWRSDGVIEPFDKRKIVDSLVREAGIPPRLAKEVATIAEEKLQTLKIEYLTSSLIRELVNTVLLDMGMEKYRYRLSRVGLPVYDVSKQLEESFKNGDMREFMEKATEAIMREYVMIDVLPRDIATMHVTGIVDFYPISTWFTGVVSRSYLTPLTEEENEELQIEIASNMLNIKHEINMKAAREGSLKNAFKIALNLCKKALMKNCIVSVTVNMDDLLNSCRDLSWMVKNSEKIDRFRMVIQVDKPYYRNLVQLEDISKEINLRYNVTNLIDSTFYGFKMPVEKSSTSLHIVLTINLLALALESGKDLDVFYNNLVNILTRCLTVLVKKTSLSKKIRKEEGDGNVIYIVSVCSLMKTLKTMFGYNQILNISKELHVFI
ncbi:MAG: helix-turn-helix domain-containing protein, partial [Nitrososphaerota archaeon]